MFDWNVYPNSRIAEIRSSFLRNSALLVRNIAQFNGQLGRWLKSSLTRNAYKKLVDDKYAEAVNLAVSYIRHADVAGDIGEFGTHGVTASVIAEQLAFYQNSKNIRKTLHLFDSFEGFPQPEAAEDLGSYHVRAGVWRKGTSRGFIAPLRLKKKLERKLPPEQIYI